VHSIIHINVQLQPPESKNINKHMQFAYHVVQDRRDETLTISSSEFISVFREIIKASTWQHYTYKSKRSQCKTGNCSQ